MPYASLSDVQSLIPTQIWTASGASQPSDVQVQTWLAQTSRWIDGTLRWRYASMTESDSDPIVSDPSDLLTVQAVCALLAAAQVWDVLGGHAAQEPSSGPVLREQAYRLLAYDAAEGRSYVTLPNTTLSSTGEAALGQPEGTFTDPDDG